MPKRNISQEILQFNGPLTLPDSYDTKRARQAAVRRKERIGNNPRIKGFVRRTSGLFVPHSGTENAAVVDIPENKAQQEKRAASERVKEKYKDSDVSLGNINLWSHFASNNAHKNIRYKYRQFMSESGTNAARIGLFLLNQTGGEIQRDAFTYDPDYRIDPESHKAKHDVLAYNSVLKYAIDLEAFTGTNPQLINKRGQRKWAQIRHARDYAVRMERAHEQMESLADDLFAGFVDEAYWSHSSRNRFWINVQNEHEIFLRNHKRNTVIPEVPPIEAYNNTPEYLGTDS